MATPEVIGDLGEGGAGLSPGHKSDGNSDLRAIIRSLRDELDDARADIKALKAKMDLDTGITDVDYAASLTVNDPAFVK